MKRLLYIFTLPRIASTIDRLQPTSFLRQYKLFVIMTLLFMLGGCVTKEEDVLQVFTAGTWGLYVSSIGLIYLIVHPHKINRHMFFLGLIIFIILSVIGPYRFGEGSIIYWRGEPSNGIKGYFSIIGLTLSGFLVGIILLPPLIVYTIALVYLFRKANLKYYELIAYFNAFTFGLSFIFKWPITIMWIWHFLPFSSNVRLY